MGGRFGKYGDIKRKKVIRRRKAEITNVYRNKNNRRRGYRDNPKKKIFHHENTKVRKHEKIINFRALPISCFRDRSYFLP